MNYTYPILVLLKATCCWNQCVLHWSVAVIFHSYHAWTFALNKGQFNALYNTFHATYCVEDYNTIDHILAVVCAEFCLKEHIGNTICDKAIRMVSLIKMC